MNSDIIIVTAIFVLVLLILIKQYFILVRFEGKNPVMKKLLIGMVSLFVGLFLYLLLSKIFSFKNVLFDVLLAFSISNCLDLLFSFTMLGDINYRKVFVFNTIYFAGILPFVILIVSYFTDGFYW